MFSWRWSSSNGTRDYVCQGNGGGNDSEDVQAAAGSAEAERSDLVLSSMDLMSLQRFSVWEWCGKGWRVPGDVVPRGDAMRWICHLSPFSLCYFLPLRDDALGCFFCSFTIALWKSEPKKCILGFLLFLITLTCTSGTPLQLSVGFVTVQTSESFSAFWPRFCDFAGMCLI